jgi:1-acyl-sn-glycerol-3-phosphate acyltransferase
MRVTSTTWLRRALAAVLRLSVDGAVNVPPSGGVVVAANHARRQLDPLLLALATPRRLTFTSATDLRRRPLVRLARRLADVVFVEPDLATLVQFRRRCGAVLSAGGAIAIFPEGPLMGSGRGDFQLGAAYLALSVGVPVVPAWIEGRTRVRFGRALAPPRGRVDRPTLRTFTDEIRRAVVALQPAADVLVAARLSAVRPTR